MKNQKYISLGTLGSFHSTTHLQISSTPSIFRVLFKTLPFPHIFHQKKCNVSLFFPCIVLPETFIFISQPRHYCFCAYTIIKWTPTQDFSKYPIYFFSPMNTFLPRLDLQEKFIPKGRYTGFLKPGVTFTKRFENLDLTSNFPSPPELLEVL